MVTIPELVGKKTKKKTPAGRDVYKTLRRIGPVPKGSSVSELGVSIPLNKKKTRWLNAPSIYHGVRYTDDEIKTKIKKAWCEQGNVQNNPILEMAKHIVFHEFNEITIERPEKFGGNVNYNNYQELEQDFSQNKLSPADLKPSIAEYLVKIVTPTRDKLTLESDLLNAIQKSV